MMRKMRFAEMWIGTIMKCVRSVKYRLCEEIGTLIYRYWWSQQDKMDKCHWIGWDKLTKIKKEGGLGFREMHIFNLEMLARQGWRILKDRDTLCARVLKTRYYRDCSVLHVVAKPQMSHKWCSILKGIELLKEGIVWRIGSRENVKVWEDPWIPRAGTRRHRTRRGSMLIDRDSIQGRTQEEDIGSVWFMTNFATTNLRQIVAAIKSVANKMNTTSVARFGKKISV
ncbi:hypothetical protein ZWY2020_040453 [Hordeum vulgare]|nr:hypothetical protein ZWY2020_040453 [Hordeum vulgare]